MKIYILYFVIIVAVAWGLGYLIWNSAAALYSDWKLGRELDEIESDAKARRQQKRQQEAQATAEAPVGDDAKNAAQAQTSESAGAAEEATEE